MSMLIQNQKPVKIGRPQIGRRRGKNTWNECEAAPIHLCRLRYFGEGRWGFAFFTYSNEKYELSVYPDGQFLGTPEEAFITSAGVDLNE
jgi:hypothetical protein